jgi:hypothetical protein
MEKANSECPESIMFVGRLFCVLVDIAFKGIVAKSLSKRLAIEDNKFPVNF